MATLKQRKEDFVSGLEGGSILEINVVTSIALCSYFCWNLVRSNDMGLVVDFFLIWVSLLLSITSYSNDPSLLISLLLVPSLIIFCWGFVRNKKVVNSEGKERTYAVSSAKKFKLVKKPYLTAYRGGMLVMTVLAILAVDFNVFPRRFAKVETWGTSMMDLGVGSFVFSNGVVASRALIKEELNPNTRMGIFKRIFLGFRSGAVLLVLGLLRLFFVKNLEYQEHVTEYGVHWNFFLTLALLPPVLAFIDPITKYIPRSIIAASISVFYEWLLMRNDKALMTFLILGERVDFFSSNREGILSFFGYCSIFLWGQNTGFYILGNVPTKNNFYKPSVDTSLNKKQIKIEGKKIKQASFVDRFTSVTPLRGLLSWTFIFLIITNIIFMLHPFDVSRRFANISYTAWVVTYNLGFLSMYCLIDNMFGNSEENYRIPLTLEAINSNGLLMFLLSNIATGLINMSISTIDTSDSASIAVLMSYSVFLAAISVFLYQRQIFLKF